MNAPRRSIAIIGGGFAGICAGIYARMNGYQAHIYEMHTVPGGLCTAWQRKGYTIDYCIHWLVGSAPASSLYQLWEEVGLAEGLQVVNLDEFYRLEGEDGRTVVFYRDLDRLRHHLRALSPIDAPVIDDFIGAAKRLEGKDLPSDLPPREIMSPWQGLRVMPKMLPFLMPMKKWRPVRLAELAARFQDPLLQRTFSDIWTPTSSAFFLLVTLAWLHNGAAGYPVGGSLPLSRAIEKRFLDLRGEISYGARVSKILVEANRAVGIRLEDGREVRADRVISAADGHATLWELLDGRYTDARFRRYYESYEPFPGIVFVGIGVNRDCSDLPQTITGWSLPLAEPWTYGTKTADRLTVRIHNFDPTLAPAGKTVITAILEGDYEYWSTLRAADHEAYKAAKHELAQRVIARLDQRLPGIAGQVEMVDVATPATTERYTGNWRGSMEGWLPTPGNMTEEMPKTLTGLSGFHMAGQWVAPGGGLPAGVMTGRGVIQLICKEDGVTFRTPHRVEPGTGGQAAGGAADM